MDVLQIVVTTAITALVSGIVGALTATVVGAVKAKKLGHDEMALAQQEALKLLVMDKAKYLTHEAVKDGEITIEQRAFIRSLTAVAHTMGANGEMTACENVVDNLPTKR